MKSAAIQVSGQGQSVVVAGQAGQVIRVFAFSLSALPLDDQTSVFSVVKWQSSGGTLLTGGRALTQNGLSWDMPMTPIRVSRPDAYFETLPGEGLALFQDQPFDLGGWVNYEQVLI